MLGEHDGGGQESGGTSAHNGTLFQITALYSDPYKMNGYEMD